MKSILWSLFFVSSISFANVAITDIPTLKIYESKGFSLGTILSQKSDTPILGNLELSKLPAFAPVMKSLDQEMSLFRQKNPDAGVGMRFGKRLFDLNYLKSNSARFALVGLINRMDQSFKDPESCGETRLIYRLAYRVVTKNEEVSSRLPMTINLVMRARKPNSAKTCADLAMAWKESPENFIARGPLSADYFSLLNIKQLEINLQMVRWPAAVRGDFGGHAEYLLKVYAWAQNTLNETTLENQIDRNKLKDSAVLSELKTWLMKNAAAVDAGTFLIPEKYLAKTAYSISPGGINRSGNRPFYNLFSLDELKNLPYGQLEIIKSPTGFLRRLNDSTCVGCHQTRGIGGFHFTGKDPQGKYPGNSVFLPGSAHFFGDLNRRKMVQEQFITGTTVDFSRGFSARPKLTQADGLEGQGVYNGWGAHCSSGGDASFDAWSCAPGLKCTSLLDKSDGTGQGICLPDQGQEVGDPCEVGKINTSDFGVDKYVRTALIVHSKDPSIICSPQSATAGASTGGFLNGSIRKKDCVGLPDEAVCGPLPSAKSGFNACVGAKTFASCIKEFATGVGLRGCDAENPCRDDYICSESYEAGRGACVPPYFLFQFRVDGHPLTAN